jgi:hypothetical protein
MAAAMVLVAVAGWAPADAPARPCLDDPGAACLAAEVGAMLAGQPDLVRFLVFNERKPLDGFGHIFTRTGQDALAETYLDAVALRIDRSAADQSWPRHAYDQAVGMHFGSAATGHAAAGRHAAAIAVARAAPSASARFAGLTELGEHYMLAGDPPRADAAFERAWKAAPLWLRIQSWLPGGRAAINEPRAQRRATAEAFRRYWAGEAEACAPLAETPGAASAAGLSAKLNFNLEAELMLAGCDETPPADLGDLSMRLPTTSAGNAWPQRFHGSQASGTLRQILFDMIELELPDPPGLRTPDLLTLHAVRPEYLSNLGPADVRALTAAHLLLIERESESWRRYIGAMAKLIRRGDRAGLLDLVGQTSPAAVNSMYNAWGNVAVFAAMAGDVQLTGAILDKIERVAEQAGEAGDRPCRRRSDVGRTRLVARVFAEHGHDAAARATARRVTCAGAAPLALMDVALRLDDRALRQEVVAEAYAIADPGERVHVLADLAAMMLAARDWGPAPGR